MVVPFESALDVVRDAHVLSQGIRVAAQDVHDAFFDAVSHTTAGEVTWRLYKGNLEPVSRKSPYSLYSLDIASFTMGASYDQRDARGFINLIGLPIQVRASLKKVEKKSV